MKKFYKVNLYKLEKYRNPKVIGTIIVENGIFYAKEIMTKQKFRIHPNIKTTDGLEKDIWLDKYNMYLFLTDASFCDKNIATVQDLEEYINNFELDSCPFSKVIKIKQEELEMKRRIKEIKQKLK